MIGYRNAASWGDRATLGEITPSVVIITILASVLTRVQDFAVIQRAFGGIRIAVCALIVQSVLTLSKKSITNTGTVLLFLASVALTLIAGLSPIAVVVLAIVAGLIIGKVKERRAA